MENRMRRARRLVQRDECVNMSEFLLGQIRKIRNQPVGPH